MILFYAYKAFKLVFYKEMDEITPELIVTPFMFIFMS